MTDSFPLFCFTGDLSPARFPLLSLPRNLPAHKQLKNQQDFLSTGFVEVAYKKNPKKLVKVLPLSVDDSSMRAD